jgi:trehalose 6-phosphate phosphatase
MRASPARSAVLLDIDGTLAPITAHASQTEVPEATRTVLAAVAERFALVACVSGRRAVDARRIVALDGVTFLGNHGTELLRGDGDVQTLPEVAAWEPRVRALATGLLEHHAQADDLGVWIEDKGPIQAVHWRGSPDVEAAERLVERFAAAATADGLALHRGRMVLELRPPVAFDKGSAIRRLLEDRRWAAALYAGDDHTDVDAFAGLRGLRDAGIIERAVCVAVRDDGSPVAVAEAADVAVDGTDGVRRLLEDLLRP